MKEINQLWQERLGDYWTMALRYWRLIGNSGLVFTLYILLIGGGYYYHQWIRQLPQTFPTAMFITLIISIFLIRSPIRTFLKPSDVVFLLPLEDDMATYFRKSIRYSMLLQSATILGVLVILSPLYLARIDSRFLALGITFIILIGIKAWNSVCSWYEKYISDEKSMRSYTTIRGTVTLVFTYLLFRQASVIVIGLLIVLMLVLLYVAYLPMGNKFTLKWERLIEMDEKMLLLFLKLANLFTDVPRLRDRIKPRKWLDVFTKGIPYQQHSVFKHFYLKTFFRANDYFGIYLRLIIIGALFIYFLPGLYAKLVFLLLFMYITGLQLLTLWKHDLPQALGELYPIGEEVKQNNFLMVFLGLQLTEAVIYGVVSILSGFWLLLLVSLVFPFIFTYGIVKIRIQKVE